MKIDKDVIVLLVGILVVVVWIVVAAWVGGICDGPLPSRWLDS